MEIRKAVDAGGDIMVHKFYDGVNFLTKVPGDAKEHIESIIDMKYKGGDVLLATYPKSVAYNSWCDHVGAWVDFTKKNPDYPLLLISYEDMKKDLRGSVQLIAEYLGLNVSAALLDDIASKCEFKAMIKEKTTNITTRDKQLTLDGSNVFYRKGDVGDWKNWFTVEQNEKFDMTRQKDVEKIDLPVVYTL